MTPLSGQAGFSLHNALAGTGKAPSAEVKSALREKAEELEGVFLNTLMSQMFSSIDARGAFGGGYAEETWRSMQAEQYASQIAQAGGVGLADQIMSSLLATQEAAQQTPAIKSPNGAY